MPTCRHGLINTYLEIGTQFYARILRFARVNGGCKNNIRVVSTFDHPAPTNEQFQQNLSTEPAALLN